MHIFATLNWLSSRHCDYLLRVTVAFDRLRADDTKNIFICVRVVIVAERANVAIDGPTSMPNSFFAFFGDIYDGVVSYAFPQCCWQLAVDVLTSRTIFVRTPFGVRLFWQMFNSSSFVSSVAVRIFIYLCAFCSFSSCFCIFARMF